MGSIFASMPYLQWWLNQNTIAVDMDKNNVPHDTVEVITY